MEMKRPVIPWSEFLAALGQQHPAQLQLWLRRWQFSDGGALLAERNGGFHFPILRWLPGCTPESPANSSGAESCEPTLDHR